jgi:hypothetical protein
VVSFSRALDTKDPSDVVISPGPTDMIFAYSDSQPPVWHGPQGRIHVILNLFSTGSGVSLTIVSGPSISSLKILHGFTMYCAFAFIYPLGIYIARYHQDMAKWLTIHKSLQGVITSNVKYERFLSCLELILLIKKRFSLLHSQHLLGDTVIPTCYTTN